TGSHVREGIAVAAQEGECGVALFGRGGEAAERRNRATEAFGVTIRAGRDDGEVGWEDVEIRLLYGGVTGRGAERGAGAGQAVERDVEVLGPELYPARLVGRPLGAQRLEHRRREAVPVGQKAERAVVDRQLLGDVTDWRHIEALSPGDVGITAQDELGGGGERRDRLHLRGAALLPDEMTPNDAHLLVVAEERRTDPAKGP